MNIRILRARILTRIIIY